MDLIRSKIEENLAQKIPFVCYAKPDSNQVIGLFQRSNQNHNFDPTAAGFCMVSFEGNTQLFIPESDADCYFETFSAKDFLWTEVKPEFESEAKVHFESIVAKAVNAIEAGELHKVVLSRKEMHSFDSSQLYATFERLLALYPTAFRYFWYHPDSGVWMGATPEQLAKKVGTTVKTVALAGTQVGSLESQPQWGEKEIREQQLVTDYIVSSLTPVTDSITISEPYTHQAGSLLHIKTDIEAELNSNWEAVVKTLHPTPAVGGFPKSAALQFIAKNEGYDRRFYAGYLGEWNKNFGTFKLGDSDLYVNLRCMQWENDSLSIYVGCGINAGSIPEKEFMETVHKAATVKRAL